MSDENALRLMLWNMLVGSSSLSYEDGLIGPYISAAEPALQYFVKIGWLVPDVETGLYRRTSEAHRDGKSI